MIRKKANDRFIVLKYNETTWLTGLVQGGSGHENGQRRLHSCFWVKFMANSMTPI